MKSSKNIIPYLTQKYDLAPNSYLKESVWAAKFKDSDFPESAAEHKRIQEKWAAKVGAGGWYGIEMTDRMPVVFYKAMDEFLEWALERNPNLEIHQIAQKFTWIKIYLGNVDKETFDACWQLTALLTDKYIQW